MCATQTPINELAALDAAIFGFDWWTFYLQLLAFSFCQKTQSVSCDSKLSHFESPACNPAVLVESRLTRSVNCAVILRD